MDADVFESIADAAAAEKDQQMRRRVIYRFWKYLFSEISQLYTPKERCLGVSMTEKNENIHLFIIDQAYSRGKVKQNFSTTASALEDIFGADFKTKSF